MSDRYERAEVFARHPDALERWREFDAKVEAKDWTAEQADWFGEDPFEETHWESLIIGFLIGQGVPAEDAIAMAIYL